MSDEPAKRGIDVELIAHEIKSLREAALQYADAVTEGAGVASAGLHLEDMALQYTKKLEELIWASKQVDYGAIAREAVRTMLDHGSSDN